MPPPWSTWSRAAGADGGCAMEVSSPQPDGSGTTPLCAPAACPAPASVTLSPRPDASPRASPRASRGAPSPRGAMSPRRGDVYVTYTQPASPGNPAPVPKMMMPRLQPSASAAALNLHAALETDDAEVSSVSSDSEEEDLSIHRRLLQDPKYFRMVRKEFYRFDGDDDGSIDRNELALLLDRLGMVKVGDDDVRLLMAEIDQDGNGCLEFDEFILFIQRIEQQAEHEAENRGARPNTALVDRIGILLKRLRRDDVNASYLNEQQLAARRRIYDLVHTAGTSFLQDGQYRRWWDVSMLLCLVYIWLVCATTIVIPLEPGRAVIIMDLVLSMMLLLDVLINTNTAVQAEKRTFALITIRRGILMYYLRSGRMFVDILSGLPLDQACWLLSGNLTAFRLLRGLRLLKFVRYRDLFAMTDRGTRYMDPDFARFFFWTAPVLSGCFKAVLGGHAVVVGRLLLSPQFHDCDSERSQYLGQDRCTDNIMEQYGYAWFWVWALITTQGLVALENSKIYAYAGFVMVLSLLVQGHVVANMSALYIKSNVRQHNMDSMRSTIAIMGHYAIPEVLQQEVLSFQYHSLEQNAAVGFASVLDRLPRPLQVEVGMYVKVDLVSKVPMFASLSQDCRIELAQALEQTFREPQHYIIRFGDTGEEMFFLMHGFADVFIPDPGGGAPKIVATVKRGDFFGEVALLGTATTRRTATIQALTYCDLYRLDRDSFQDLCRSHAELRREVDAEMRRRGISTGPADDGSAPAPTGTTGTTPGSPELERRTAGSAPKDRAGSRADSLARLNLPGSLPTSPHASQQQGPQSSTKERSASAGGFDAGAYQCAPERNGSVGKARAPRRSTVLSTRGGALDGLPRDLHRAARSLALDQQLVAAAAAGGAAALAAATSPRGIAVSPHARKGSRVMSMQPRVNSCMKPVSRVSEAPQATVVTSVGDAGDAAVAANGGPARPPPPPPPVPPVPPPVPPPPPAAGDGGGPPGVPGTLALMFRMLHLYDQRQEKRFKSLERRIMEELHPHVQSSSGFTPMRSPRHAAVWKRRQAGAGVLGEMGRGAGGPGSPRAARHSGAVHRFAGAWQPPF